MIKLNKLILATMMLGFSGLSVAHFNQGTDTIADDTVHAYCGGSSPLLSGKDDTRMIAVPDLIEKLRLHGGNSMKLETHEYAEIRYSVFAGQSDVDVGELRSEYAPPAKKRPIAIGLVTDEKWDLMPTPISGDACEVPDICRHFVLPRS